MEEKKDNRGGARAGAGRKTTNPKNVTLLGGYRYTQEEADEINDVLNRLVATGLKKSEAILKIVRAFKENNK